MIDSLILATLFLAPGQQTWRADCRPAVVDRSAPSRSGTATFYDQGRDSIAALHPRHRLLAERRAGMIGSVEFSLLAYQPEASLPVSISALAVDWQARRSWAIETLCGVDAWAGGLIDTLVALGALGGPTPASAGAVLIEAVRSTVAREIDSQLPSMSFDAWLTGLVGSQNRMRWEVNDCGEQTGNPALDRGRTFPRCVEVRVDLSANRAVILVLSAGSQQKQPAQAPGYHHGVVMQQDGRQLEVRRLTDLTSTLKAP